MSLGGDCILPSTYVGVHSFGFSLRTAVLAHGLRKTGRLLIDLTFPDLGIISPPRLIICVKRSSVTAIISAIKNMMTFLFMCALIVIVLLGRGIPVDLRASPNYVCEKSDTPGSGPNLPGDISLPPNPRLLCVTLNHAPVVNGSRHFEFRP